MQVRTFTGASSQEILARIKAEMGPEAVIIGNRTFKKNGEICHEITAGIDRNPVSAQQPVGTMPGAGMPSGWSDWHKDWLQIKEQIFALMKPAIQMDRLTPRQRVALEYLQREGISDAVAVDLYKHLLAQPGSSVLECLCGMVPVQGWGSGSWPQRWHIMAGPFGAGKTTTALRYALQWRQREPEARIAFINADCLRGNGRLVLRHWAELSDFLYLEASDAASMEKALRASREAALVFIDAPGVGRNGTLGEWRASMGLTKLKCATHLVLTPLLSGVQMDHFLERYRTEGPASIIWTHLDEAASYGSLVNVACATGLPVSGLSYGSELKESLAPATEPLIWRLIFKRQLPGEPAGNATSTPQSGV